MEKSPLILEKCPKVESEKVTFEKYMGLTKNRHFYKTLEKDLRKSTKNNFKIFYSYLI